jgi:phage terminase large subunit-like protein
VSYIDEYYQKILSGEIKASKKLVRTFKHVVEDIINNEMSEYYYNHEKAMRVITFVERYCKHSKGKMGGKPFILELWQKAIISVTFGVIHKITELRKYNRAMLVVGRKNGKSTLSAAIALYLMTKDDEPGAEIFSVSTKKDQSKIIWLEAKRMVKKSLALSKRIRVVVAEMTYDAMDSFYKYIGRDSETLDGLNVHGAMMDEVHAWTDMNMYDVIVDGTSSREQWLIFITTTAGTVRENVYDRLYEEAEMTINSYDTKDYYDEHSIFFIYEIDNENEWREEENWVKANPGLGTIKKIENLREKVDKAKRNSALVSNLLCKDFNRRQNVGEAHFTYEEVINPSTLVFNPSTKMFAVERFEKIQDEWKSAHTYEIKPRYGVFGIDLSSTTDLTCATAMFKVKGDDTLYVRQMYWLPADTILERAKEDKVPYDIWYDQGYLRASGSNKVDYKDVADWFRQIQYEEDIYVFKIGYDSWSASYLVNELKAEFGEKSCEPVIQGMKTLSSPMQSLSADIRSKRVNYGNNPILIWCMHNLSVEKDKNNNIKPMKINRTKKRIDGFASMLDAYVMLENHIDEYMGMI